MKAEIDREGCIACGLCAETCPAVFRMAGDGYAEVHTSEVPQDDADAARQAEASCPTSVIRVG